MAYPARLLHSPGGRVGKKSCTFSRLGEGNARAARSAVTPSRQQHRRGGLLPAPGPVVALRCDCGSRACRYAGREIPESSSGQALRPQAQDGDSLLTRYRPAHAIRCEGVWQYAHAQSGWTAATRPSQRALNCRVAPYQRTALNTLCIPYGHIHGQVVGQFQVG